MLGLQGACGLPRHGPKATCAALHLMHMLLPSMTQPSAGWTSLRAASVLGRRTRWAIVELDNTSMLRNLRQQLNCVPVCNVAYIVG